MSAIDKAIEQLEKSVEKIREFSVSESKAVEKAVRESSGSARTRVETDYAATKKRLLKEAKDAEKSLKEAITRIEKAFGQGKPARKRATRSTTKSAAKPKRKTATKPKAKAKAAAKPKAKTAKKAAKKATKKAAAKKTATKAAAKSTRKPKAKTAKKPAAKKSTAKKSTK